MRRLLLIVSLMCCAATLVAREPLYVVNGVVVATIDNIPHEDIESIDVLPADDDTVLKWGVEASEGVILVTLKYDTPARFVVDGYTNFTDYLLSHVRWDDSMPVARVSLRVVVGEDGRAVISEVLQSTSRQLLKRVERAIAAAPVWRPAMRDGVAVCSTHLVNVQLPEGRKMPAELGVILL